MFLGTKNVFFLSSFNNQKTHQAALVTRDLARQNQHKKEIALLSEGKEREKRLIEYRKTAEDRKNYFESMERHMFASRTSIKVRKHQSDRAYRYFETSKHAHQFVLISRFFGPLNLLNIRSCQK